MKISDKLKSLRQEKGWSQAQLAKKVAMKPQNISRYERGVFAPSVDALVKFAKAFGVTIDYLMDDSEKQAEYSFKDKQLLEYFLKVDKLNEEDRNLIKGVIESVLAKSKVEY
jgi:transcriptional regulator with XRE-family HTH domain